MPARLTVISFLVKGTFIGWGPQQLYLLFLKSASLLHPTQLNDIRVTHLIQDWSNQGLKRNEENEAWPWYNPGKEADQARGGTEQTWPSQERPEKSSSRFQSLESISLCLSWIHPPSGSVSILSLLPINSYILSQLTWPLSLAVRRLDYYREQGQGLGDTLTQLLCGFHTDTGIHALSVSRHHKIQTGLHDNHTSLFLGKNKIECLLLFLITGLAVTLQPYFSPFPDVHVLVIHLFLDSLLCSTNLLEEFNTVAITAWVFWKSPPMDCNISLSQRERWHFGTGQLWLESQHAHFLLHDHEKVI